MPSYIVTCTEDSSPEQVEEAKNQARSQGGRITHEYKIIKGFAVEYEQDVFTALQNNKHVKAVEKDQEMRIS